MCVPRLPRPLNAPRPGGGDRLGEDWPRRQSFGNSLSTTVEETGVMNAVVLPPGLPRIDLRRMTTTDSEGKETEVPYSPVAVDMGDGLVLDTSGNLSLVPHLAFGEEGPISQFQSMEIDGPGWNDVSVSRRGSTVSVDFAGWNDVDLVERGGGIDIDGPGWTDWDVRPGRIDGPGWDDWRISSSGGRVSVDGPGWSDFDITRSGDTLRVDGPGWSDWEVRRSGDRISIDGPGWSDTTVTRSGDRIEVDNPGWSDWHITSSGGRVEVDGPGWEDYTLTVR